jgi:hypothetical protein
VSVVVRRSLLVFAALFICLGLIAIARRAADAPATSDTAVIESYARLASQGRLLVGAYSRFQWHHPGPLYFYLLAPFYVLGGGRTAGLNAGAAAISIASMALVVWVLMRRAPGLAAIGCAFLVLYAWRAGEALASPWNPHVPLLPTMALIVVAADVVAGSAMLLPVAAALASLSGQAHIALMPCVLAVFGIAFVRAVVGASAGLERLAWRRSLAATAGVLTLAWAPAVYEQLTGTPRGNMTELWRFFLHEARSGQPLAVAVSAWSDMLVGLLRPDFYVAHGWPFVESPVRWAEWLSIGELAAVTAFTVRGWRWRRPFDAALGALLLVASGVALWSATRVDERIFDHDVFWMAGVGVLLVTVAVDWFVSAAWSRRPAVPLPFVRASCLGMLVVASILAARQVQDAVTRSFEPPADARIARALAGDIEGYMEREGARRPLVKIDQDAWGVAAGAILDLQKRGRLVAVEDDWVVMFTPEFRVNGREDVVLTLAMPPEHLRLVDRRVPLISAHEPIYAHGERVSAR